jgi:hypothetical protein
MSQNSSVSARVRAMPQSCPALNDEDYDTIYAAVMETERGRRFLAEFARRNRNADTELVLSALDRLAAFLQAGLTKAAAKEDMVKRPESTAIRTTMPTAGTGEWRNAYVTQIQPAAVGMRTDPAMKQTASTFGKVASHAADCAHDRFVFNGHNQGSNASLPSNAPLPRAGTPTTSSKSITPPMITVNNPTPAMPAPTKPPIDAFEAMTAEQKASLLRSI